MLLALDREPAGRHFRVGFERFQWLGAISEPQSRGGVCRTSREAALISRSFVLGLDEAETAKAKGFLSPSETSGFATRP
jgi:hypothetical protein